MITGQTISMIFNIHNLSLRYAHVEMENLKIGKCHHYWSIPFIKCLCQPSRHPAPPLFSFFERKNYVQNWHFVVDPWRFGKDKKKGKLPYFTKERRISLLEISYAHVGSILGLGTASQANDQTFLIWLWTEDLCLVLRTWSLYQKTGPCYYHLNPLGNTSAIFLDQENLHHH